MKLRELNIIAPEYPIMAKGEGMPVYIYSPQEHIFEDVRVTHLNKFMITYHKVKRSNVMDWLGKVEKSPPNPLAKYELVVLTFIDDLMGEPRFGGAIYRIPARLELTSGTEKIKNKDD